MCARMGFSAVEMFDFQVALLSSSSVHSSVMSSTAMAGRSRWALCSAG